MATKQDVDALVKQLQEYSNAYYNNTPLVDDVEYDSLFRKLEQWDPTNPFLEQVGATIERGTPFEHTVPMLSTEKAYTTEEMQNFVNRVTKEAIEVGISTPTFRVTPKLDGMAGKDENGILATRGNGRTGTIVNHIFDIGVKAIGGRNQGVGEIVMNQSYFDEHLNGIFTHPRNVVVGCVNADTIKSDVQIALNAGKIHFVPYTTLPSWTGSGPELVEKMKEISIDLANKVDYPLDGMVAEVVEDVVKAHMGATNHHNRWQIAIKEEGQVAETTVLDIGWQTGRTGVITPVLRVDPKEVDGAIISNVTAHNAGNVQTLQLGPGAKIEIIRSGFVIPKIKKVLTPSDSITIPDSCPSCNATTKWRNDFIQCSNKQDCPAQSQTGLFHFFKTIENAKGFGKKTLEVLVEHNYTSLESIFALTRVDFFQLGFGDKQSENLEAALQTAIDTEIEDARFLAAFGIEHLGIGAARRLLSHHTFENLSSLSTEDVESIDGFGDKTSESIVATLQSKWNSILSIYNLGFSLRATPLESEKAEIESPIAGKTICFTGKMEQNRDDMQTEARNLGGLVVSSVSGKLQILVTGAKASASKVAKAKNATVYTEAEYNTLIGKK